MTAMPSLSDNHNICLNPSPCWTMLHNLVPPWNFPSSHSLCQEDLSLKIWLFLLAFGISTLVKA